MSYNSKKQYSGRQYPGRRRARAAVRWIVRTSLRCPAWPRSVMNTP